MYNYSNNNTRRLPINANSAKTTYLQIFIIISCNNYELYITRVCRFVNSRTRTLKGRADPIEEHLQFSALLFIFQRFTAMFNDRKYIFNNPARVKNCVFFFFHLLYYIMQISYTFSSCCYWTKIFYRNCFRRTIKPSTFPAEICRNNAGITRYYIEIIITKMVYYL